MFLRDGSATELSRRAFPHGTMEREFVPTPDGGREVVSARFVHPSEALRLHRSKEMRFMPPQYYLISTLAEIMSGEQSLSRAQRGRVRQLSEGVFGTMVVLPRTFKVGDGTVVFAYGGDELVGGPVGARHRSTIRPGPGGVSMTASLVFVRCFC